MNIRPSWKRMHVEDWRPWQRECYLGVHTGFVPADPEDVFEYGRHCPELNRVPLPQAGIDYTNRAAMDQILQRAQLLPDPPVTVASPQVQLRMKGGEPEKTILQLVLDKIKRAAGQRGEASGSRNKGTLKYSTTRLRKEEKDDGYT